MIPVLVNRTQRRQLELLAADEAPREACALLAYKRWPTWGTFELEAVYPLRNVHPSPEHGFELDPRDVLGAIGVAPTETIGVFHSHPDGVDAVLSATDRRAVAQAFSVALGGPWLVLGAGELRAYVDEGGELVELTIA